MISDDIATAVCNSPKYCAIAQTVYRQLDLPIGRVRVTTAGVSIRKGEYRYYYRVPHRACVLVHDFDEGRSVKPIAFTLTLSDRRKIQSVPDDRRQQVNKARRAREQAMRAVGGKPKVYKRYGI